MEEWKPIDRFRNYEVSNHGRLRNTRTGAVRKLFVNKTGYPIASISQNGKRTTFSIHREVAKLFVPNPDGKPQVNHIDHDRSNNRAENLEWTTQKENLQHAVRAGRMVGHSSPGESHPMSRLTAREARAIRRLYAFADIDQETLAKAFDCSRGTISGIVTGRNWKSAGY